MLKATKLLALVLAAGLTACGGGGGSPGDTNENYSITVRADKKELPLNIAGVGPGMGVYSPYTTTLYVEARKGNIAIPGGEDIFACNLSGGLSSGSLYYLDGKSEHETEVDDGNGGKIKVPNAYRSITLGANSGGNSFHFHAGDAAGAARITCSVTDPRDNRAKSASVDISVGGTTGKPASVRMAAQTPGFLGTKTNANGLLRQMGIQVFVMDDTNQPTGSSSGANVQVRILAGTDAAQGARLVAGPQSGTVLQLPSIGGIATFSLLSGNETGPIFMEVTTDRFDNNVSNGITDPITSIEAVSVLAAVTDLPTVDDIDLGVATKGVAFTGFVAVKGGLPPYTWSATGLPPGISIDASTGMISGKASEEAEERIYRATVTVADANKRTDSAVVTIKVVGGLPEDFAIGDCNVNTVCPLSDATVGVNFTYSFIASVNNVTWTFTGLPSWLTAGSTGSAGVLNGTPTPADCGRREFVVTATRGAASVTRRFSIQVVAGAAPAFLCGAVPP